MKKKARFSIRNKILFASVIINIVICLAMGIFIYNYVKDSYIQSASDDTLALAQVAALQIKGDQLVILNKGDDGNSMDLVIMKILQDYVDNADIHTIYTVGRRDDKLVYLTDLDPDTLLCEEVEPEYVEEYSKAISSEGYVSGKLDKASDGTTIISAYAPIRNSAGVGVGMLGIDYIANRINDSLRAIIARIVLIGGILVVISIAVSVVLANGISRNLKKVNNKVYDLVSTDGDLTHSIEVSSNDEVGDIAGNINNLLSYIRNVVRNISGSSQELSESVDTALNTTIRTNDEINNVSATMEEMSAAMEETSASLQQVQESAKHIKSDVTTMFENVQNGTGYANEMETRAKQMRENAEVETETAKKAADDMTVSLNDKIERSKAVEKISGLTQTILEIASETNLLSLNASIEAARAGEHGRGFAVVAQEINSLATSSGNTAKEIQIISEEVIDNVHALASEAERMVNFVREKTIGGYQQLMDTGIQYQEDANEIVKMLHEMEDATGNIESLVNSVSESINDVSYAVEESAKGVTSVAAAVSEMSDNMSRNKDVVNENADIARQLDNEVNKFKY